MTQETCVCAVRRADAVKERCDLRVVPPEGFVDVSLFVSAVSDNHNNNSGFLPL